MNEKDYQIWLNSIPGIGYKTINKLLNYFGSFERLWTASSNEIYSVTGMRKKAASKLIETRNEDYIKKNKDELSSENIKTITRSDQLYPQALKNIKAPPHLLYVRGNILEEDRNSLAIVGSRKCTSYGKNIAYRFAKELAGYGITIISGMAYGVDSAAHRGALDGGGRTIGVLGCGVDICYPKSNMDLMKKIINNGAIISEYPLGTNPIPGNFPQRNRMISGLSKGVLVVEAGLKSGTLITVDYALEQGKDVFAIPGNINCSVSEGTNKLIKQGAKPVTCIEDILEEFNIQKQRVKDDKKYTGLSSLEIEIVKIIEKKQPIHIDMLGAIVDLDAGTVNSLITILEIKEFVEQLPGKILVLK